MFLNRKFEKSGFTDFCLCQLEISLAEGYEFPPVEGANELIVDAAVAPVWKEGDECFRCKVRLKP